MDEQLAHRLYVTPPDEFVAARNGIVKQLKSEGKKDEAAVFAAMRRPSWVDWALNVTAVDHASTVEGFADAAGDMHEAQRAAVEGRGAVNLRPAMAELRDQSAELARRANEVLTKHGRPEAIADLSERIGAIAADAVSTQDLRAGLLRAESGGQDNGFLDAGDADEADEPHKPTPRAKRPKPPKAQAGTESRRDYAAERRRLERAVKDLEQQVRSTTRDLGRSDTSMRQAKAAVDSATEAVSNATANLERAKDRLDRAEAEHLSLSERAESAKTDLERARRDVAKLGD